MCKEKYIGPRVTDTSTFVQKARWKHGDKYDYSGVDYVNNTTQVKISCAKHGEFFQRPGNHMSGKGCVECGKDASGSARLRDTAWFIESARNTHGDKFDYSNSIYTGIFNKLKITCQTHGEFHQGAKNHIDGQGCPECSNRRPVRRQTDYYIDKANKVHGNRYDYSKVIYSGVKTKVEILCKTHGGFWQTFDNHAHNERGCPLCAGNVKKTAAEFIANAYLKYGSQYDYSEVCYQNHRKPVKILCREHGVFEQTPRSHLEYPRCGGCLSKESGDEFIRFVSARYNDFYDYSSVTYVDETEKVKIICPDHGEFKQSPSNHRRSISGGCPQCKLNNSRSSSEEFKLRAVEIHGDGNYDYSQVKYETNNTKVKISCKYGHEFMQTPSNHLTGFGCSECATGWGKTGIYGTDYPSGLYVLRLGENYIKVGLSKDIERRVKNISNQSGLNVSVIKYVEGPAIQLYYLERKILRQSMLKRHYPVESFAGVTECLKLSELPKVMEIIKKFEEESVEENKEAA